MVFAFDFVFLLFLFSSLSNGKSISYWQTKSHSIQSWRASYCISYRLLTWQLFCLLPSKTTDTCFNTFLQKLLFEPPHIQRMPQLRTTITPNYYTACQIGFVPSVPHSHSYACVKLSISKDFLISVYNLLHILLCFAPPFFWLAFVAIVANPFNETRTASHFVIHMFHSIQNVFMFEIYLAFANSKNNILLANNMQNWIFPLLLMPLPLPPLLRSAGGKSVKSFCDEAANSMTI